MRPVQQNRLILEANGLDPGERTIPDYSTYILYQFPEVIQMEKGKSKLDFTCKV